MAEVHFQPAVWAFVLCAALLAGCAHTMGTELLDPGGPPVDVTPDQVRALSGPDAPYLIQVGDEANITFRAKDYRADGEDWEYRIEVGDTMEVRLSQQMGGSDEYRFDAGDLIGISFLNNWSLNVTRTVRPDGYVTFENIGDVKAAGLTAVDLQAVLTEKYRETGLIEGDPMITVTVEFSNPDRLENISRDVVVRPDGRIRLPSLERDILVAGLTVDDACAAVQKEAVSVLKNSPVVSMVVFPYVNTALAAMNAVYTVRPDGMVSIPRLGEVAAAGYGVEEFRGRLAEACRGLLHNPVEPSVSLAKMTGSRVYVGGEVAQPGVYPLDAAPTALQALIMSGGTTDRSQLNSVLVIRRNPEGKPFVFRTNLRLALKGSTENDLPLRSFDVVYVPLKNVSRANMFVQQYIDDIVPFDNTLGVTGTYYLNRQRVDTRSRNTNFSTGVNVLPGVGVTP